MSSNYQQPVKSPKKFENIRKSNRDGCQYRGLMLQNEMKVLLISDPTTDKSAASLLLAVGTMKSCNFLYFSVG